MMRGEIRDLEEADNLIREAIGTIDPLDTGSPFATGTPGQGLLLFLRGHIAIVRSTYDPGLSRVEAALGDLESALALLPEGHLMRSRIPDELALARALQEVAGAAHGSPSVVSSDARAAFDRLLLSTEQLGRDHPEYPMLAAQAASGLMLRGLADRDLTFVNQGVDMLEGACAAPGLPVRERARLLAMHGFALQTRYVLRRHPQDLNNAIDRLQEARRAVEQIPGSPDAGTTLLQLASAYRLRANKALGDLKQAEACGLAGVSETAWDVLLQDAGNGAVAAARRVAGEATEVARWSAARGRSEAAIGVLELSRGILLQAATRGRSLEETLRQIGRGDLGAEWEQREQLRNRDPEQAIYLRYQVMAAVINPLQRPCCCRRHPPGTSPVHSLSAGRSPRLPPPRRRQRPRPWLDRYPEGSVTMLPLPRLAADSLPLQEFNKVGTAFPIRPTMGRAGAIFSLHCATGHGTPFTRCSWQLERTTATAMRNVSCWCQWET